MNNIRINALGIVTAGGKILVSPGFDEKKNQKFYRLLGGGVEFGETSHEALIREFKEELGVTILSPEFLRVIENIFEFNGKQFHEITFLYKTELGDKTLCDLPRLRIIDSEIEKYAEWVDIKTIKESNKIVYPAESLNYF